MNKKKFIEILENKIENPDISQGLFKQFIENIIYTYAISLFELEQNEDEIWNNYKPILYETCEKYLYLHESNSNINNIENEIRIHEEVLKNELNNTLKYYKENDDFAMYVSYINYLEQTCFLAKKQVDLLSFKVKEKNKDFKKLKEFKDLTNYVKVLYFQM